MKKMMTAVLILALAVCAEAADQGFEGRPPLHNVSMPTGFTLSSGEFQVGLGPLGLGLTDRLQFSTNILLFLFQDANGDVRFKIYDSPSLAAAAGVKFHYWTLEGDHSQTGFLLYSLYLALSRRVNQRLTLHLSGQWSSYSSDLDFEDMEDQVQEHIQGTSLTAGLEYELSRRARFLVEGGYDATFRGPRFGAAVLFGWKTFHLKLGVSRFHTEGGGNFFMPVIGLWWRFGG